MAEYHFERNEIVYTLTTIKTDTGYAVTWHCPQCGKEGTYHFGGASLPAARGRAEARIYSDHHVPAHVIGNAKAMGDSPA